MGGVSQGGGRIWGMEFRGGDFDCDGELAAGFAAGAGDGGDGEGELAAVVEDVRGAERSG